MGKYDNVCPCPYCGSYDACKCESSFGTTENDIPTETNPSAIESANSCTPSYANTTSPQNPNQNSGYETSPSVLASGSSRRKKSFLSIIIEVILGWGGIMVVVFISCSLPYALVSSFDAGIRVGAIVFCSLAAIAGLYYLWEGLRYSWKKTGNGRKV
jgi:hypothetical protein